ncbi:ATP synthase subunit C [Thermosediminibacter oceani]|uniref:H+transporting two-sector ATPase C subunit n=1 Tax=Thermosediminibacter oceani (strain ATCC BAA-1034 / DSM 16646 / JW/IW-1228P) TaxID=555079 RepID=D9RYN2_THEOJ|nr:ATP synthase subunit C [Thermosediminibacter oceani]ADL08456.1 H+transporting two-sector ATPase C subunit [Thermosediminibacter oceani DSM 16646]
MYTVVFLAMIISVLTVAAGIYYRLDGAKARKVLRWSVGFYALLIAAFLTFIMPAEVRAAGSDNPSGGLAFIAAALSTGLATIGAGYAVGAVGSSALGAVSEDPKILGKTLIYVGLAEGIAIYGLIVSIMILGSL